jgi:hypothetical protein
VLYCISSEQLLEFEMNERVLEIAKKASDDIGMVGFHNIPTEFTKKFAELLLKECVQILAHRNKHSVIVNSIKEIKETFGV